VKISPLPLFLTSALAICAGTASPAAAAIPTKFERIAGYSAPGTPAKYDKVGILEIGSPKAKNVLVLNPGTSASAAYFAPLARSIVASAKDWQVWAVERRENLLEDQSMVDKAKAHKITAQQLSDYYVGWIENSAIKNHFELIPDSRVGFARQWGMNTEIQDLRRVVLRAQKRGGKVVVGGHSLGGSITTAYATWDFHGKPGAKGLAGLVYIDGGSSPTPITKDDATTRLQDLQNGTPWLSFGGLPTPFAGLFNSLGAMLVEIAPNAPSMAQDLKILPTFLKPPVPATNAGEYGYALDTATSPAALVAAQAHLGHLATSGNPRRWDDANELTPLRRYADAFSGWGLKGLDGTAWYHPLRLTIDAGAVADGNANDAQSVLDVHATHGHDLPTSLRIYAFGAALGGQRVLDAAKTLAVQSHIPRKQVLLVDKHTTYAHNDPNTAAPKRDVFLKKLVPFLERIAR
jgi:pimeloyl-ACP methyl ester carboxylesterase